MSHVNIEKSNLINSPITADSNNSNNKEVKRKFFDIPIIKYLVLPIIGTVMATLITSFIMNNNQPKVNVNDSQLTNSPIVVDSPNTRVILSKIDGQIQTITVEVRLLGTKRVGTQIPPSEVAFNPVGTSSNAKLGDQTLLFQSPVSFNLKDGLIEIINNFSLQPGSALLHQEIENIKKFPTMTVPIVTVVYGNAIEIIKKLSVIMKMNGKTIFNQQWDYNVPFQTGPKFTIPLNWQ